MSTRAAAVVLLTLAATAPHAGAQNGPAPAGVIVFIADDQDGRDAGVYGNPAIRTPNIDRLAAAGVRFDRAFLTTSSCSPSRSSILTGRYPHSTAAEDLHTPLPADQTTIARLLGDAGVYTASIGKWHLGDVERANWETIVEVPGADLADRTLEVFERRPTDRPFFLWVASTDPHRTYPGTGTATPHDPADVRIPPYLPDHPRVREDLAAYYDESARFDSAVGQVLAALDAEGIADETLVFYLSDNGMPFPRAKTTLFDSGILTPFIVRWPREIVGGAVEAGLVSAIDIAPTIADAMGLEMPTAQGASLMPTLADGSATGRDAVFAEANWHDYEQFSRAVRTGRFKLVRNYYWDTPLWHPADSVNSITWEAFLELDATGRLTSAQRYLMQPARPFEELYDLASEPDELTNVVDDPAYRDELAALRIRLDNWRVETDDRMPAERRLDGFNRNGEPLPPS
ncbi:MAG: sulfatase [Vicinamibacterales bacterium]|jgi:arylsulfatase A-like enzyme|nr:sulfatase [Vicinamibacterales bacterium]MDP6608822.1 sulfatase [Vicinamibacterales bacterium]